MFTANNGNKYNTQRARVKTQSVYSNETTYIQLLQSNMFFLSFSHRISKNA